MLYANIKVQFSTKLELLPIDFFLLLQCKFADGIKTRLLRHFTPFSRVCNVICAQSKSYFTPTGGRGHFRSRDKDGDHDVQSAIATNPILHANIKAL